MSIVWRSAPTASASPQPAQTGPSGFETWGRKSRSPEDLRRYPLRGGNRHRGVARLRRFQNASGTVGVLLAVHALTRQYQPPGVKSLALGGEVVGTFDFPLISIFDPQAAPAASSKSP